MTNDRSGIPMKRTPLPDRTAPMKRGGRLKVRGRRRFVNGSDPSYLTYIRCQPCLVCVRHTEAEPHHVRSKGAGGTDRETVPLCRSHHREGHQIGWRTFAKKYRVDLLATAQRLAATYDSEG